jgi:hypothetical protein
VNDRIDILSVTGGARPIDQWSGPHRHVSGGGDVVSGRIGEHHRRVEAPVTEVVREECAPAL